MSGTTARPTNILLLGGGAREHAIGATLCRGGETRLYVVSSQHNPGLAALAVELAPFDERDGAAVVAWARARPIELAVIGPEAPLESGVADALLSAGIPTAAPCQAAAQLETSKRFMRELMHRHSLAGQAEYRYFDDADACERFLRGGGREYALKPVGLTGGKGVQVMGVQLDGVDAAVAYAQSVIEHRIGGDSGIVVEERLVGEEFTLQAFVDAESLVPMPLVQDFKRAYEGDRGPNTGSMGSYSQPDGLLPFLGQDDGAAALEVMRSIVAALRAEGVVYRGVMYGQFMLTASGVRLVEINARFGDPESINVLSLLRSDLVEICAAIASDRLAAVRIDFAPEATVCKYVTPPGYPEQPGIGVPLVVDEQAIAGLGVQAYYAKVDGRPPDLRTTSSRSLALVAHAASIAAAEAAVERALEHVRGDFHVRHDIGRPELIYRSARPDDASTRSMKV